jgi:uncharacterized membrane protein YdjX (TVP38/TMEM64 family)
MKGLNLRWIPLVILVIVLIFFYHSGYQQFLSFAYLKQHRMSLVQWTHDHYAKAVMFYIVTYIIAVAISFPGATFFTLIGGFLFGIWYGTFFVVFSATIGSLALFTAVRFALDSWLVKSAKGWTAKMRHGFQQNATQYLLVLRLLPLFPFWAVNIAAALLGVNTMTFVLTTMVGIIPGSFVYVLLGNSLGYIFDRDETPNMSIIFEPMVLLPLLGLAVLSLLPSIYHRFKGKFK